MSETPERINMAYTDISELLGRAVNQELDDATIGKLKQIKNTVAYIDFSATHGDNDDQLNGAMAIKAEIAEDLVQKAEDVITIAEFGLA